MATKKGSDELRVNYWPHSWLIVFVTVNLSEQLISP